MLITFVDLEDDAYSYSTYSDYEKACFEYVQFLIRKELIRIEID
jgi:hypothetical protein